MKHLLLAVAVGFSLFCNAQLAEKKFRLGIGVVGGTLTASYQGQTSFSKTFSIGTLLQGEYRFSRLITAFGSGNYNLIFDGETGHSLNHVSALAGPRIYPSKVFFLGMGLGYGVMFAGGNSISGFSYEPQVGLNMHSGQLVLGYNAMAVSSVSIANLNIKAIFKL